MPQTDRDSFLTGQNAAFIAEGVPVFDIREKFGDGGNEVVGSTPAEFGRVIADDTKFWGEILASMPKLSQ